MIKSLKLGNFKAFGPTQNIPLRPLTLIFGANSSGKSSILHGLILANETMKKENFDVYKTTLGGESVDLGGFKQYIHRRDDHNRVTMGFEIEKKEFGVEWETLFHQTESIFISVDIGLAQKEIMEEKPTINPITKKVEWKEVPTGTYETGNTPKVLSYEITTDKGFILKLSRRPNDVMQVDGVNDEHPIIKDIIENLILSFTTTTTVLDSDWGVVKEGLTDIVPKMTATCPALLPKQLLTTSEKKELNQQTIFPLSRGDRRNDLLAALEFFIPRKLSDLVQAVYNSVESKLESLIYLGPLRSFPSRFLALSQDNDTNWYAGGGYAWDLVLKDEQVRAKVNEWLSNKGKLSTPYKLQVNKLFELDEIVEAFKRKLTGNELERLRSIYSNAIDQLGEMMEKHGKLVSLTGEDIEKLRGFQRLINTRQIWEEGFPWKEVEDWQQLLIPYYIALNYEGSIEEFIEDHLEILAPLVISDVKGKEYLTLIDKRSNTVVTHRDVGIGISQVLPVLVYSYANKGKSIAIEQPEIHLHPALQAELGDVFIESALGENKNSFILETHSEHLILRILRRIRETTEGTLPEGNLPIHPEDVQVLYVQPSTNGSVVHSLSISSDGDFEDKWPDGFFAERAEELF